MVAGLGSSRVLSRVGRLARRGVIATAAAVGLSLVPFVPAQAAPGGDGGEPLKAASVPVGEVKRRDTGRSQSETEKWAPGAVSWPTASTVDVDLPAPGVANEPGPLVRAGSSPVVVGRARVDTTAGVGAVAPPSRVLVQVLDRAAAQRVGVAGLLLRVQRTDGEVRPGPVALDIDVSGFAGAYGGDWLSRLRLVRFPGCLLTTPDVAGCATPTPVAGSELNDRTAVLSAQVDAGPVAVSTSDPVERKLARMDGLSTQGEVLAVTAAGASSDTGDFTKTPYSASYEWQAGNSGAGFAWSYDIDVPPVPAGLVPNIELGYSSGAVDGQTAGVNVQPGLVGEGWDFSPGYIERAYRPCVDDTANSPYYTNATNDQCWRLPNAHLVWGGRSIQLIPDDASGVWHGADDEGIRVELVASFWSTADLILSPGDWDGDGNADVLYRRGGKLFMVRGDGAGGWLAAGASKQIGSFSTAGAIFSPGDFDGDAKRDLLWRKASDGTMWLIAGNGSGGWKTGSSVQVGTFGSADIVFSPGDFDGDGKPDVLWRRASDGALMMITGNGAGGWKTGQSVQIGTGWNGMDQIFSPADFDGDGKSDVIGRKASDHNLYLYRGNGAGGWVSGSGTQISTGPASADVIFSGGDFDGDAKSDVLWRQASSKDVFLLAGNGSGGWKTGTSVNITAPVRTGTGDDEYWKLTTTDGTQYFFGRSRLPNWTSGARQTLGQWTVPVFANHSGEPCFTTAGFASSWCSQAWRWNLDYVVDRHGNSMAYFYDREQSRTGLAGDASSTAVYDRGGRLSRIEYGMRAGTELASTTPPAKVSFSYAERCLSSCWSGTAWASAPTTANWPDTPWDLDCTAAPCTGNLSPSFWMARRLTGVNTYLWSGSGSTYNTVDQWDLTQSFPSTGNGTSPVLWLSSIVRIGKANGGSIALPSMTFGGTRFDQRADYDPNGTMAQPRKYRISTVNTETGGQLAIAYSGQDSGCQFGSPFPDPDNNTKRCFPQYYYPQQAPPGWSWWHKYIVNSVTEKDLVGGSPDIVHSYAYSTANASTAVLWAHDEGLTTWTAPLAKRSWADWRGYPTVTVTEGPTGNQTQTKMLFFRGLKNDYTDAGENTRASTITDSLGEVWQDYEYRAGFLHEKIEFDGAGGQALQKSIVDPVAFQTGQRTLSTDWAIPSVHTSYINRTAKERTFTWLPLTSAWRATTKVNSWDSTYGVLTRVDDQGDTATAADDLCERIWYTFNTTAYLINFPNREETVGVNCATTPTYPGDAVEDERNFYDNAATYTTAPTTGNITKVEKVASYTGTTPNPVKVSTAGYDAWGRQTSDGDALGRITTTAYTQNTAGLSVTETETNPAGHVTTTTLDPAVGEPVREVDPNGKTTEASYDALGRLVKVWLPGRDKATQTPNTEYVYTVRKSGGVSAIETRQLGPNGNQISSFELYDGLLRLRQTQTVAPDGKRMIVDTGYDGRGLEAKKSSFYNSASGPTDVLASFLDADVASQRRYSYDGLARQTVDALWSNNVLKSQTTTVYQGDRVGEIPPAGDTTTQQLLDARGRITERRLFQSSDLSGAFDATTYSYDDDGQLTRVTDPAGNHWDYGYDLLGRQTSSTDPDKGTSSMTYDNEGQLLTSTDARGQTLAYTYDSLGRNTAQYDTNTSGTKLAQWTYDTLAKGQSTSATRYVGADTYVTTVTGYDDSYRPLGTSITLPASEGPLAGTYTSSTTYNVNGSVATIAYPAAGGLPAETVTSTYTDTGFKSTDVGLDTYLASVSYDYDGTVLQNILGTGGNRVQLTNTVDAATRKPVRSEVYTEHPGVPDTWDERLTEDYTYNPAEKITSISETEAGAVVANQCFTFDTLSRLTEAWTTTASACQSSPSQAVIGGTDAYWHSYTYDTLGRRAGQTLHDAAGDTTHTYHYDGSQPHGLTSVDQAGPGGTSTNSYTYDQAGNTTARPGPTGAQMLTWDVEGELATVSVGGQDTTFTYDADGNRLARHDPNGTVTVYMGSTELRKDPSGAVTATRYYGTTAIRTTNGGLSWLAGDHHGTGEIAINASTLSTTRRRLDPFGMDRGAPVSWPGEKGFVGGVQDPTGLTHLGAREYDPALGRFTSVDPVFDTDDPQSMTGYAYCSSDPVNCVDADGNWGFKRFFTAVAKVADVVSTVVPGPIGTALGVVSAGAYLAAGNKTEAAWALAGAAAAFVPGGKMALKATRAVVGAARAVAKAGRTIAKAAKAVGRATKAAGHAVKGLGKKAKDLDQRLKVRAGEALAKKAGKNRAVIEGRKGRTMYDVAGRAHYEKSIKDPNKREIPTPHEKFQFREPRSPSGFGKFTPVRPTGWWGLFRVWWKLR